MARRTVSRLVTPEKLARSWWEEQNLAVRELVDDDVVPSSHGPLDLAEPWEDVPEDTRGLMLEIAARVIARLDLRGRLVPSEQWPPYRWLWTRVGGRPWTHIMRDNPRTYFATLLPLLGLVIAWNGRRFWPVLAAFAIGLLTGHVWW